MTFLMLGLLVLICVTFGGVLLAFVRPVCIDGLDAPTDDMLFYRAEQRCLQADAQAGLLSTVSKQQHEIRLHRQLLALQQEMPAQARSGFGRPWPRALILASLTVVLAGLLYVQAGQGWGIARLIERQRQHQVVEQALKQMGGMPVLIHRFQALLKQHPKDAHGWYLLGRLYLSQGKFALAHHYLQQAWRLSPQDNQIALALATAALQSKHSFGQALQQRLRALSHHPGQAAGLALQLLAGESSWRYH